MSYIAFLGVASLVKVKVPDWGVVKSQRHQAAILGLLSNLINPHLLSCIFF